jgi:DNA-binding transcriptional ArsR family regulator
LEAASQAFDEADRRLNLAQSAFDSLLRRPTGMAAERAIKAKLKEYRDSGLVDIESRREFNGWLASEEMLIELDLTSGRIELGTAIYGTNGALEGLDQRLDDAAALGIDLAQARVAIAQSTAVASGPTS